MSSELPWEAWLYGSLLFISIHFGPPLYGIVHYTADGPLRTARLKGMATLCLALAVLGIGGGFLLSKIHLGLTFGLALAILAAPYAVVWQYRRLALTGG
ncbi:MAG: hypothetical protein ACE366_07875 [Bradymonadia bacterium]